MPLHPKPQEARHYIKALESRVAELELYLTRTGQADAGFDHLEQVPPARTLLDEDYGEGGEVYSLLTAVRDMSLNTSGSFVGGSSTITLARILESVVGSGVKDQLAFQSAAWEDIGTEPPEAISPETGRQSSFGANSHTTDTISIQPQLGDRLLQAYLGNVSVNSPVVHSTQIQNLHNRRDLLEDPYEKSILHLVYALGGQFLESVGEAWYPSPLHCENDYLIEARLITNPGR